jgi:HEAT repeat protein
MVIEPVMGLLLVAFPPAASMTAGAEETPPAVVRSLRLLRDSRRPGAPMCDDLALRLRQDVGVAHPALVDMLVAGRLPALREDESAQTLSVHQRDLVLKALGHVSERALLRHAERLLKPLTPPDAARAVAIRLLALGAGKDSMGRMFGIACPDKNAPIERACEEALEWSIEFLLATDPSGTRDGLMRLLNGANVPLLPATLRALGDHGDPAGLEVLLLIAERHLLLRNQVFAQARRLGASGDSGLDQRFATLARRHLDPNEPNLARSAALVLGELCDPGCVPELIELLGKPQVSMEAHWALGRISGLGLTADRDPWRLWYAGEKVFFGGPYEECLNDLHGSHRGRAAAAIRELSRHRLYRHEVAAELALALKQAPPLRRRLLCNALEAMASLPTAPTLVPLLEDPDPAVAAAALRALGVMTRLDLPADRKAWSAELARLR